MFLQDGEWTPLLLANYSNHTDVLELLINHGAQLDIINNVSLTYYNFLTSDCNLLLVVKDSTMHVTTLWLLYTDRSDCSDAGHPERAC